MSAPIDAPRRLWRIAGALAVAHVALMFAGLSMESSVVLGDRSQTVAAGLVHSSLTSNLTGGYLEFLGFLVFLAAVPLLARLLDGASDVRRWLSSCINLAGAVYVAVTVAVGFAAGAAAVYDGHHGAPLATVTTVDDIRNFGFYLSVGVLGVFTLAVAGAVQSSGRLPRWLAWTGYLVGIASIAAIPAAAHGAIDDANIAWLAWFLALAAVALRGPRSTVTAVEPVAVRA